MLSLRHVAQRQGFGSPLTVFEEEYHRGLRGGIGEDTSSVAKPLLYQRQNGGPRRDWSSAPTEALSAVRGRDAQGLRSEYLELHTAFTKQAMQHVAKNERIAELYAAMTDMDEEIARLRRLVVAQGDTQQQRQRIESTLAKPSDTEEASERNPPEPCGDVVDDEDNLKALRAAQERALQRLEVGASQATAIEVVNAVLKLNAALTRRNEDLERQLGQGWAFCEPSVRHRLQSLEGEIDRMTALNVEVSAAYLQIRKEQTKASEMVTELSSSLSAVTRRRDQLEREVVALRVRLERADIDRLE